MRLDVHRFRRSFTLSPLLFASTAWAHPGQEPAPISPHGWEWAWSWEPGIVLPLVVMALLYGIGSWRIRKRNALRPAVRGWEIACFWAGWLSLVLALDSPLHKLGEVLFSAHMTQHEVLMVISAPLIVFSKPLVATLFALPESWRFSAGAVSKNTLFRVPWAWISGPLAVWLIHGVTIWVWHVPVLYQATLDNEWIHALQHVSFLGTALLFWWTLIHGRYGRIGYGVAFVYVFTTALHTSILGALMTFTQRIWYPIYDGRTLAWNLSPLEDQQLGGLIMWIPSGIVFLIVGLAMFAAWLGESERRQKLSSFPALVPETRGEHAD
jgi:putative membrane protein